MDFVHPSALTRNLRTEDLQGFLIHGLFVAGKSARHVKQAMDRFYKNPGRTPFDKVRRLIMKGRLRAALRDARVGNYTKNERGLREMVRGKLDLRRCSVEELERIHGISRKTARYFVLYTRPNARVAALDVHMLKFLKLLGYDVPKNTPSSLKRYEELQTIVLELADKAGMTPAELDSAVWRYYSSGGEGYPIRAIIDTVSATQ